MDGVLTVDELRGAGMTRSCVDRLGRIDALIGLRVIGELDDSRLTRIHAALVAAPTGAIPSGWAAAVLHGIPGDFLDGTLDRFIGRVDLLDEESGGLSVSRRHHP